MKNIKKFYPLIVGLVLLISVAAYGTRAYFSDSTKEDVGIELTLGNIEIKSDSFEWKYENYNDQINGQIKVKDGEGKDVKVGKKLSKVAKITNVKPGDVFSKLFTFTNYSSLKSILDIENYVEPSKVGPFDISYKILETGGTIGKEYMEKTYPLDGGESINVVMTIAVDTSKQVNDYNFKDSLSLNEEYVMNLLTETIKVRVDQAQ